MNIHQETMKHIDTTPMTRADAVTWAGLALALFFCVTAILAGVGNREGWWHFMTAFAILRIAAAGALISAVVSLAGGILVRHEHHPLVVLAAAAGIVIGLTTAGVPLAWLHTAETLPRIHDISTDTVNPPKFVSIMPLRKNAPNSAAYEGKAVAIQQKAGYPDIKPLMLPLAQSAAFDYVLGQAIDKGWDIVDADPKTGRIEATATTFWFGFKDDIVIRISRAAGGSRIDMRSVSRVGLSDVGTNATRIREFLHRLADNASIDRSYTSYSLGYSLGY